MSLSSISIRRPVLAIVMSITVGIGTEDEVTVQLRDPETSAPLWRGADGNRK